MRARNKLEAWTIHFYAEIDEQNKAAIQQSFSKPSPNPALFSNSIIFQKCQPASEQHLVC